MDAKQAWTDLFGGGAALWYNVTDSETIAEGRQDLVAQSNQTLNPHPALHVVKFGGDWGGMWGNDQVWTSIAQQYPNVIPYLYCVPDWWPRYGALCGALFRAGFKGVILDCEEQWYGAEHLLDQMLLSIEPDHNVIGVTGYAWFDNYPGLSGPTTVPYAQVVARYNVVYFPQAYLVELTAEKDPVGHASEWLAAAGFDAERTSIILAEADLATPARVKWAQGGSIGVGVWHNGDVTTAGWEALVGPPRPPGPEAPPPPPPQLSIQLSKDVADALQAALAIPTGVGGARETPGDWQWPTWREAAINYKGIADELGQELATAKSSQENPNAPAPTA
jgi:hypothetical protein